MTSSRLPRVLLLATAALWLVAFVVWTADALVEPVPHVLERALRRLPLCVGGVLLCVGMGRLLQHARGRGTWATGVWTVIGVVLASFLYALANELVFYVIAPRWGAATPAHIPDVAMTVFWVFAAWSLLYYALVADAERRDREVRLAQTTVAAVDAQHKLLLQQINPHFLFNALNTVYALVLEDDNVQAKRSLLALSSFLRKSLESDAPVQVTLAGELESVRHYLDIELVRFGNRLRLIEEIPAELLDCRVPNLILQPLVENCIKHGLAKSDRPVTIRLWAAHTAAHLTLGIEDDGPMRPHPERITLGVGLSNVARRLELLYGADAGLTTSGRRDGGFVACIHFPMAVQ